MRQDTKFLLDRLGEATFRYYDFESPSAETDVWPIFEALLLDERVVGKIARNGIPEQSPEQQVAQPIAPARRAAPEPALRRPALAEPRGIFGNYGAAPEIDDGESVRDQLQRLVAPRR